MKLYERIENNNFDEIDRNRAIELIEGGNGHLVYNENYFKLQKENEEIKISNREIDKECSRLEKKEVELINENEHYKDLIYALKTYYDITEEDLEKCMKNDR